MIKKNLFSSIIVIAGVYIYSNLTFGSEILLQVLNGQYFLNESCNNGQKLKKSFHKAALSLHPDKLSENDLEI